MTQEGYEELDNAYQQSYQQYSKMVRRGYATPDEIAEAEADLTQMATALGDYERAVWCSQIKSLVTALGAAVNRGDLGAICEARDGLLDTLREVPLRRFYDALSLRAFGRNDRNG